jgi:hypothetical protein
MEGVLEPRKIFSKCDLYACRGLERWSERVVARFNKVGSTDFKSRQFQLR